MTIWRRDPNHEDNHSVIADDAFNALNLFEVLHETAPEAQTDTHYETRIKGVVDGEGKLANAYGAKMFTNGTLGVDLLDLPPNTRFPLHVHPGHHLLQCLRGVGTFTIGDHTYDVRPGDLYMVEGNVPHAVGAGPNGHTLIAFGSPHMPLDSAERMKVVTTEVVELETAYETAARINADITPGSAAAGISTT